MTLVQRSAFATANQELVAEQMKDADQPKADPNPGLLDVRQQRLAEAEAQYRTALWLDPAFVPAMVNLADLDRTLGMNHYSAELLRRATTTEPNNTDVQFSLGLPQFRRRNDADAPVLLRRASELAPNNVHYSHVHAIALNIRGASGQAVTVVECAHHRHPSDCDIPVAPVSLARNKADFAAAPLYGRELTSRYPADMHFRAMVQDIDRRQAQMREEARYCR